MWLFRVVPICALLTLSCGGEVIVSGSGPSAQPPTGPDAQGCYLQLDGQIRGVATEQGMLSGPCACSSGETTVKDANQLANAMVGGGCIRLEGGAYGAVQVPTGVQLVGASSAAVRFDNLSLEGDASVCRATVALGVDVRGRGAELKYVSVVGGVKDAVVVHLDSSLRLIGSTVAGASRYGVSAFDAVGLEVVDSLIENNQGPGLWMQCASGCDCGHASELRMTNTLVTGNAVAGVSLAGTNAVFSGVQLTRTTVGDNFQHGLGLSVSGCSTLTADNLRVEDNADAGVVVSASDSAIDCAHIARNLRGTWFQAGSEQGIGTALLRRATIEDNEGVGVGLCSWVGLPGGGTVSIEDSRIVNTRCITLPVLIGGVSAGAEEVCDGVMWNGAVEAHFSNVQLVQNPRVQLLIVGPAVGSLHDVTAIDGGPMVQVNADGGSQPSRTGTTPPLESWADYQRGIAACL
jgi:hypothetical protein